MLIYDRISRFSQNNQKTPDTQYFRYITVGININLHEGS